ncbi:armadillo-type protein [Amanita rubescens]|nr:armadillo-type protein [Amanita rubescens]
MYKFDFPPVVLSFQPQPSTDILLMPSSESAQYLSLYDSSPPRSRRPSGISASIWAPQPQPSDITWPKTLDSFSRVVERDSEVFQPLEAKNVPLISREDIFGPSENPNNARPKDVGAIGDGRKKNSPDFDSSHVEQLLRTLNLNSPAPFTKKPAITLGIDTSPSSPDFSPASATSSLLTPTDLSPPRPFDLKLQNPYDLGQSIQYVPQNSLLFEQSPINRAQEPSPLSTHTAPYRSHFSQSSTCLPTTSSLQFFEPFSEPPTPAPTVPQSAFNTLPTSIAQSLYALSPTRRMESRRPSVMDWRLASQLHQHQLLTQTQPDWMIPGDKATSELNLGDFNQDDNLRSSMLFRQHTSANNSSSAHEPINFLSLLHPSSSPPYHIFVARIIKSSDQQASIFLQQKLKVADTEERGKIVDAICARGFEMMAHRFGNWAVQRCLEAATTPEERKKVVSCMRGRVVELATNCYGCHVLQKALDCEEDIRLLIVSELLLGDPAQTLVNKHASHVWSKIMELSWTPPAPPIFAYVNKSLKGKWASLACHETGSLVVQHAFENLEAEAKDGIVDELLNQGPAVFSEVAKSQWGSYCIQHILEHGSEKHRKLTLDHLLDGLLEFATNEQGSKSITKALKEGGKETLDRIIKRMCEPAKSARRAMIVDLALSVTGSQLIASVLPTADKEQRALLYECIRGHIVTLRGCKTGSKVIWLFALTMAIEYPSNSA